MLLMLYLENIINFIIKQNMLLPHMLKQGLQTFRHAGAYDIALQLTGQVTQTLTSSIFKIKLN
jgi:hypothetical protein